MSFCWFRRHRWWLELVEHCACLPVQTDCNNGLASVRRRPPATTETASAHVNNCLRARDGGRAADRNTSTTTSKARPSIRALAGLESLVWLVFASLTLATPLAWRMLWFCYLGRLGGFADLVTRWRCLWEDGLLSPSAVSSLHMAVPLRPAVVC